MTFVLVHNTFTFLFCHFSNSSPPEAKLIDGKEIAKEIRIELREQIKEWMEINNHRAPQLTAILVGADPASQTYVRNKMTVSTFIPASKRGLVSYQLIHALCFLLV